MKFRHEIVIDADQDSVWAAFDNAENMKAWQPTLEYYLPYIYPQPASILDYLTQDALLVVDDWQELETAVRQELQSLMGIDAEPLLRNRNVMSSGFLQDNRRHFNQGFC